jgi:ABC-2 type transport system ATP-binding protein
MTSIVQTWNLGKRYKRTVRLRGNILKRTGAAMRNLIRRPEYQWVLQDVSLTIRQGEFFGVVGPNGAGKTTFLKLLSGLLYPDCGSGQVYGYDLLRDRGQVRRSVVIAPAQAWNGVGILWQLTCRGNLLFRARLCGIRQAEALARADQVLERLQMAKKANDYTWNLSAGELHKLSLAMTFIAKTPLVILDEPTSHLDPEASRLIREFAKEELNRKNGQTVVLSTHYLEEADALCDRLAVFHQGRLLDCDTPAALKQRHLPGPIMQIRAVNYSPDIGRRVKQQSGLLDMLEDFEDMATGLVKLGPIWGDRPMNTEALRRNLESEAVRVISMKAVPPTLDHVYFQMTRSENR